MLDTSAFCGLFRDEPWAMASWVVDRAGSGWQVRRFLIRCRYKSQ